MQLVDVLASTVDDFDLIAQNEGHFYLLLTESDGSRAGQVVAQVTERVRDVFGAGVDVGVASFPDEEVTLTGLMKRAEARLLGLPEHHAGPNETPVVPPPSAS